jgi:hypothetical protein
MEQVNSNTTKLSGHHLRSFSDSYKGKIDCGTENMSITVYGEEFVKNVKELWSRLLTDNKQKVLLVSEGDDICKFCRFADDAGRDCNVYYDRMKRLDEQTASEFGLEIGKVYLVSDILRAFDSKGGKEG